MKNLICFGILLVMLGNVRGQTIYQYVENAQTRIPDSLIECYRNQSLRHPENRLPLTIDTFIDIVRKVENYQKDAQDVSVLATSILHRFRQDGIQRSPGVVETEGVVPYSVSGKAFFKHRLILKYLVPSNGQKFPNESLSQIEMCTLHFMLSHSIERTQRGDESTVCGKLANYESRRSSRIPRDARFRRQIEDEEAADDKPYSDSEEQILDNIKEGKSEEKINNIKNVTKTLSSEDPGDNSKQVTNDTSEINVTVESEENDNEFNSTYSPDAVDVGNGTFLHNESKSGKFIFDDGWNIETNNQPAAKAPRKLMSSTPSMTWPQEIDSQVPKPRVSVTTDESECPLEFGAVRTQWGTVSLGNVLAGIASGLYSQQIQVQKLVAGGPRAQSLSDSLGTALVDNMYAATLAGDLAEVTLEQGPKGTIKVGTNGGWNSTIYPRWYFDKERTNNEMTDAEIRGGLDGLILATKVKAWKDSVSASRGVLKLSTLLTMYYSQDGVFEEKYRACQRKDLYSEVAPTTKMQEQAYLFATVLDQQTLSSATVDELLVKQFAESSVSKLMTYVPQMVDDVCTKVTTTSTESLTSKVMPYSNVTIVIDTRWEYNDIKKILYYLMQQLNLGDFGSKVTIVDGKTRQPFLTDAIYSIDIETNFTESSYNKHEAGMDIPKAMEQELKKSMKDVLNAEDTNNVGGARSTIILFIPREVVNLKSNDLTIAKNQLKYFRQYLPDVKFLYLAPGNKDNYRELVDDVTNDVYTFTYQGSETEIPAAVDPLVNRIKQVPIRITNPNCGSDWKAEAYNKAEFTHSVKQYGVNYHKLHTNYFFGVGSAEVTVQGITSGILKVCYSRKNPYPGANNTDDSNTKCQQINLETYTIKLTNPCDGYEYIAQCPPLYISVYSTSQVQNYDCYDCQFPNNIKYTISNLGLGCKAGVACYLGNPLLIITAATLLLMLRNIIIGR